MYRDSIGDCLDETRVIACDQYSETDGAASNEYLKMTEKMKGDVLSNPALAILLLEDLLKLLDKLYCKLLLP